MARRSPSDKQRIRTTNESGTELLPGTNSHEVPSPEQKPDPVTSDRHQGRKKPAEVHTDRHQPNTAEAAMSVLSDSTASGNAPDLTMEDSHSVGKQSGDFEQLVRCEIRAAMADLQASQSAAAAVQGEMLRTLTELICQSSAARDFSPESLQSAFSGIEERLLSRIDAITACLNHARFTDQPSGADKIPVNAADQYAPGFSGAGHAGAGQGNDRVVSVSARTSAVAGTLKLQNAAGSVTRSWEQIKSEIMLSGDFTESAIESTTEMPQVVAELPDVAQLTSDRHFRLPEQDPSLEIPEPVNPDNLTHDQLRDAFLAREAFISTLVARLRRQQEQAISMLSAEQLRGVADSLPEELQKQVRATLKQMDDLARLGELELSLERARIARQVNQLQHTRQILESNARQLGLALNPDGTIASPAHAVTRNSSSRRWLGKLGFGQ